MKILYVYSNKDEIDRLKRFFKRKNLIVDYQNEVDKAFEMLLTNKYDIVIIDIINKAKESSQLNLCKKIRKEKIIAPLIFISKKENYLYLLESLKVGADDFLIKPFNFEELYLRMQVIFRRPMTYMDDNIELGDFILDLQNKRLYYKDFFIKLTKKEISLVEFFMRNKNKVLTRDQILENVWDINANPLSNIVEVYIRTTRQKIEIISKIKFIKNIQGIGYYVGNIDKVKKNSFSSVCIDIKK